MNITLEQLKTLDAIIRTGTFAGAAAEQHKVPSAISYAMRMLEEGLGVELFDRSHRKAVLTPAGQRLYEAGQGVLQALDGLEQVASALGSGWEPELRVVVDGALPMEPISRCLRRFAEPGLPTRLRLDVEYQEGVIDRFEQERGDLALTLGFDEGGNDRGYICTPLPPLELVLVVAAGHPLLEQPEQRDLYAELVVRDSSPRYARQPRASVLGSKTVMYLSDFHSKRLAVLDGAGFGWIPLHLIEADLKAGRLHPLPLSGDSRFTYYPQAITQPRRPLGRAGKLFLETLLDATARGMPAAPPP